MPDDVLNQDDIDSLLSEMNTEQDGEDNAAKKDEKKAGDPNSDPAAWGLSDEDMKKGEAEGTAAEPSGATESAATESAEKRDERSRDMPMEQFERSVRIEQEQARSLEFVLDIPLVLTVEVGRTRMTIGELLGLGPGSIVELQKLAGEPLEIFVNNKLVARGEAVIVNEKFGIRLTDVISKSERIESLK
ncbi:MAG: flagellar motor switch protein FliN [Candidatus Lernaella stagnicola]|nr:flagellar motor switch protein FliN [Candidatus Lernaella stagnicola]